MQLLLNNALEDGTLIRIAVAARVEFGTHALHFRLIRCDAQRTFDVEHREFAITVRHRLHCILIVIGGDELTAPWEQTLARANADSVDEYIRLIRPHLCNLVLHDIGRNEEDDFASLDGVILSLERITEKWNVTEAWHLTARNLRLFSEEATKHECLSILHAHICDDFIRLLVWNRKHAAAWLQHLLKRCRGDRWRKLHTNRAILRDEWPEDQFDTSVEELDGLRR